MRLGEPLGIVSPGSQRRNFTYVHDVVNALEMIGAGSGVEFVIGHHDSFSVTEIAKMFGGPIQMLESRRGNRLTADLVTDKTKSLGWEPEMEITSYIEILRANDWQGLGR